MTELISQLKLNSSQIKTDPESLKYYGKDWTTYFDINASAIFFPESTADVVEIVRWARVNRVALIPSGGRTGLSGAACALHRKCWRLRRGSATRFVPPRRRRSR